MRVHAALLSPEKWRRHPIHRRRAREGSQYTLGARHRCLDERTETSSQCTDTEEPRFWRRPSEPWQPRSRPAQENGELRCTVRPVLTSHVRHEERQMGTAAGSSKQPKKSPKSRKPACQVLTRSLGIL